VLSALIFLPLAGLLLIPFLRGHRAPALVSLVVTLATLALSIVMMMGYDASADGFQFLEDQPLIAAFGISYKLGLDGISYWMVMVTTVLFRWWCLVVIHLLPKEQVVIMPRF